MALLPTLFPRPAAILRIPEAIARGLTVTGFIKELTGLGLSYRRALMLSDWRTIANIEARKDVIKYVRKDRYPTVKEYAETEWNWRSEWAYKVKVFARLSPGEPTIPRFQMYDYDKPLTPGEVEALVRKKWTSEEGYAETVYCGELMDVVLIGAYHRAISV
jgi:hypothetical protein